MKNTKTLVLYVSAIRRAAYLGIHGGGTRYNDARLAKGSPSPVIELRDAYSGQWNPAPPMETLTDHNGRNLALVLPARPVELS